MKKFALLLSLLSILPIYSFSQAISVSTSQINFGLLYYGDSDSTLVEISNLTNEELQIDAPVFFDVYGSYPFYVNAYPTSLSVGQTSSFYIVYKPVHNMAHNSEVVIVSNRGAVAIDLLGDCKYPISYYDATHNLIDEELESVFKTILASNQVDLGYNGARDKMYMEIDNQRVNGQGAVENTITRVYLGTDIVGFTSRVDAQNTFDVNTEHTYPQGFFNQASPMKSDLHHLFVVDANANNKRANYAFGRVVNSITWQSGGSKLGKDQNGIQVFEPRDDHKGRAARAILYFLLRYQNYGNHVTAPYEKTMREWCFEALPNVVDIKRNDDVFAVQKNRNPFVDYPQYLYRIYNLRAYENRPVESHISVSTNTIDFGDVSLTGDEIYRVVFTNYGNTTLQINDLEIDETTSTAFEIAGTAAEGISIEPGESANVEIVCTAVSSNENLNSNLNFTTNASNIQSFSIPITAWFSTAVFEQERFAEVSVVPNPTNSYFYFQNLNTEILEVFIYDISGRKVGAYFYPKGALNASHLPSGLYHVVVTLKSGEIFSKKLMKR